MPRQKVEKDPKSPGYKRPMDDIPPNSPNVTEEVSPTEEEQEQLQQKLETQEANGQPDIEDIELTEEEKEELEKNLTTREKAQETKEEREAEEKKKSRNRSLKKGKNDEKDAYMSTLVSIPKSLNKAAELYVNELKAEEYTLVDPINGNDRKVSKSSWIVHLIEKELRRQGKIE
ncbi:hypothetical protein ABEY63_25660 [Priestia aryabhattai]|uniref:hypothetical protein n=1 Tax=Priestia aryabhattai TaxID=412384 RepID=UPI003D2B1674